MGKSLDHIAYTQTRNRFTKFLRSKVTLSCFKHLPSNFTPISAFWIWVSEFWSLISFGAWILFDVLAGLILSSDNLLDFQGKFHHYQ